jgi:predicted nucleic acid-binding protein
VGILVLDASVIFDLERGNLLEATFRVDHSFVTPDVLYDQELADDVGPYLKQLGLRIIELNPGELARAQTVGSGNRKLSAADCSAMITATRTHHRLITGDGLLRKIAEAQHIQCSGLLWLLDELDSASVVTAGTLADGLERAVKHPRCRLPKEHVSNRLKAWRAKQDALQRGVGKRAAK